MRVSNGLLALLTLTACGGSAECPRGTYPLPGGGCAPLDEGQESGDDDDDGPPPNEPGDDDDDDGPSAQVGDTCHDDEECGGDLFCVVEDSYDSLGICTETCSSWSDCSEAFWSCCDVGYGGSACIPDDWVDRNPGVACD